MALTVGAEVVVTTFGHKRGVVIEAGHDGHYRVQVDRVTIVCREVELSVPPPHCKRKRRPGGAQDHGHTSVKESRVAGRIDLHGLTADEALERVTDAVDHALSDGAGRLDIVHGMGTGRVRNAVHRYLATLPLIASFELDPGNAGVTIVRF